MSELRLSHCKGRQCCPLTQTRARCLAEFWEVLPMAMIWCDTAVVSKSTLMQGIVEPAKKSLTQQVVEGIPLPKHTTKASAPGQSMADGNGIG